MSPDEIKAAMAMVDANYLREVAARVHTNVFATISGAHLYGFASPDSDVDLRGAFLIPLSQVLALEPPTETITIEDQSIIDLDFVGHDLRKFARMMVSDNGYVLEQLFSPLVVSTSPIFEELRELGKGCLTRPTVKHYLGFAHGRRKRLLEPDATVKHLLYAYRVYLSGIHLMRSHELEANINSLNDLFHIQQIDDLVQRKREGHEKMLLASSELQMHTPLLESLQTKLREEHEQSTLPEQASTRDALENLVIRTRLEWAVQ